MRKIERISISAADRERLERLVRVRNTPQKVVWRARIVLPASDGLRAEAIAATVGKSLLTVRRCRRRYVAKGVDGLLKDATRPSRVKPLSPDKIKQVVHMTLHEKPPNATHWSVRSMAAVAGVSYSSVQRIWRAHGLKPHLVETFKVSRDKNFAAKVEDVVGLYLNPPDKALVLCIDEKRAMCGWPPACKRNIESSVDGLLAVMCPAYSRGAHGRWPRWVSAGRDLIKSSGDRSRSRTSRALRSVR